MKRSLIILLSLLVVIAFMPAAAYADDMTIVNQEVMKDGKSVKITLNENVNVAKIEDFNSGYTLKDGDYKVNGKSIVITKEFLNGETGYYPDTLSNRFMIYSADDENTWVCTKKIRSYNIKGLSYTSISDKVYNGKQKSVGSAGFSESLKKGRDYKITYSKSKRKAIGKYNLKIVGIGKYVGTIKESFKIIPKKPKFTSVKRTSGKATVKWKKVKNCSGYVVTLWKWHEESDDDGAGGWYVKYKSSTVKGKSKVKKVFKNVKKSKYDVVKIRAYKTVNGKKIYSNTRTKDFK